MERQGTARAAVVAGVAVAGIVAFLLSKGLEASIISLALAVLVGAAIELHSAHLRSDIGASLVNVGILAALVAAGGAWAIAMAAGAAIGGWSKYPDGTRARAERTAFNFGQWSLGAAVAAGVLESLAAQTRSAGLDLLVPLLLAALGFTAVNVALMALILWVHAGERPRSLLASLGPILVMQPAFVAYALLALALIELHPLSLVVLAAPVLLSRSAYIAFEELSEATESLLKTLISLIEQRDGYTKGHAERVADLSVMLARELGYGHTELQTVRQAALLHDIGKICVPLEIIRKPGRLTKEEFDQIRLHPVIGARVLEDVDDLRPALAGIRHHHERMDGGGYPDGLTGDEIPEFVRVVSIADAFDAMTSTRSYRKAMSTEEALFRLVDAGGTQLDGALVQRFVRVIEREGWEPTVAPADVWPSDAEAEPIDSCCAPTLSQQFGGAIALRARSAEGSAG